MRISDWSSDVCSSDLHRTRKAHFGFDPSRECAIDLLREPEHCITQAMAVFEQVVAGHRRQSADAGPLPHLQTTNDQAGDTARLLRRGEVMNAVGMSEIE